MTSSNGNIFRVTGPLWGGGGGSPVNSPQKSQWRGALMFSLICARIDGWVNARDLRRHRAHYDVIVMFFVILKLRYCVNILYTHTLKIASTDTYFNKLLEAIFHTWTNFNIGAVHCMQARESVKSCCSTLLKFYSFDDSFGWAHAPLCNHGLIPAWKSNLVSGKVSDEITYPFQVFKSATVEVWEWISNSIPHFVKHGCNYLSMLLTLSVACWSASMSEKRDPVVILC